ncbi:MAG: ATP-binding protein [Methylobacterium frigidaeris]
MKWAGGMARAGLGALRSGLGTAAGLLLPLGLPVLGLLAAGWRTLRGARRRHDAEIERLHDRIWRLSESEERYRSLVEAQIAMIVQRDAEDRITFCNESFARLLGGRPETVIGTTGHLPLLEASPPVLLPDGSHGNDVAVRVDGAVRWFSVVETVVVGRSGRPERLSAGRDITERVESTRSLDEARSRAEAASVAKSRFLATVSHEFRTPLNGILGMAALLTETRLDPEQRTYVGAVRTSGEALLTLIDGILDFSKIEAGRLDLAAEPFDAGLLVEGVVELLAPRAQDKGIEIAADIAEDLPARVVGDGDRVRQILLNLAGNAIKFTEAGGVGVGARREGEALVLAVHDTGPGIPPDRLPLLFEEFEQGDGSASRRHEGTGLGLAITRRLVTRMGGRIEVESRPGSGSCFTVILPLAVAEPPKEIRPAGTLAGRRVLVAAASPFEAPYLARRMGRAGAQVAHVASEALALAALSEGPPFDTVIADRALGDEAVRRIAGAARRSGAGRRIVLLSPFDRREFGSPASAGFDRYLIKPVRASSLLAHMATVEAPGPGAPPVEAAGAPVTAEGTGPRVLLAEDNPINALLARKALERLDADVTWARDGAEALALMQEAAVGGRPAYDLALLDIRMPRIDGLEAARRLRGFEQEQHLPRLRLVALTANAQAEDEAAARAAGFDGFLSKPLDLAALPPLLAGRAA